MHQFPITKRQKEALEAIIKLTKAQGGISPSYDEVAAELGVSSNAIVQLAKRLTARGHLRRLPYAHRSMQVITAEGGVSA